MSIADQIQDCPLKQDAPFAVLHVSQTQFSVARYYGGMQFQGYRYTYNPKTDELVRDDVLKWLKKQRKTKTP